MTTTLDAVVAPTAPTAPVVLVAPVHEPVPAPDTPSTPNAPEGANHEASPRDGWKFVMFGIAVTALMFSVIAVGFGLRAIDQSKHVTQAAPVAALPAVAPAPPVPATLTTVGLSDMKVTPSATDVPAGKYSVTITNTGAVAHELLVFHTDIAPAALPIGADGKVAEDAPGFKTSDGDNLEPGAQQTRVIDLTQPGTYLFVCNLPGHFAAGMHATVTVK